MSMPGAWMHLFGRPSTIAACCPSPEGRGPSAEIKGEALNPPLMHPGWIAFNEQKWNMTAHRFRLGSEDSDEAFMEAVLYANAAGKLRSPPHHIFNPVTFRSTATQHQNRQTRQWLEASTGLARYMSDLGLGGAVSLDLPIPDALAWQWHGFRVEVLYAYMLAFPFDPQRASSAVRRAVNKAVRTGYTCERTQNFAEVMTCITATERRQRFSYGISDTDLSELQSHMGEDHCRAYLCRAPNGQPASAQVVLHASGSHAIDWMAGTDTDHLSTRSRQLLINFIFEDLFAAGATGMNLGGANLPDIAASKAEWGGQLTTFYSIKSNTLRTLAQDGWNWLKTRHPLQSLRGDAVIHSQ